MQVPQNPQGCNQGDPQQHHLVSGAGGGDDICLQGIQIHPFQHRPEPQLEYFVRTQRHIFYGNQLEQHIQHPNHPQHMKPGEFAEKGETLQNIVAGEVGSIEENCQQQNDASADQAENIAFSDVRNRSFQHRQISLNCRMYLLYSIYGKRSKEMEKIMPQIWGKIHF